ncbi:MAG: anaerobic ribonucleoside-triphosphate reductase activating protein [Desulfosalsimonadaceae bacterium]
MNIGGFQKNSLIDFPGGISCVVFVTGCNFDCPYCHNPDLVLGRKTAAPIKDQTGLMEFLHGRRGLLDGVVISGGEPSLQPDLAEVCQEIKSLGFSIKLDTNGSRPGVLQQLLEYGFLDYIAMDLKTDPERYAPLICRSCDVSAIKESVRLILASGLPHEFRTTCIKPLIDDAAVDAMGTLVTGADRHILQRVQVKNVDVLHPEFFETHDWFIEDQTLQAYRSNLAEQVRECSLR